MWACSRHREHLLEKEVADHSSIFAWRIHGAWCTTVHGVANSQTHSNWTANLCPGRHSRCWAWVEVGHCYDGDKILNHKTQTKYNLILFIVFHFIITHRYCFFFSKLKACGNCKLSKSIGTFSPKAFAHFPSLPHLLVILIIFQTFSLLLCMLWWSMMLSFNVTIVILLGHPKLCPYKRVYVKNTV